MTIFYWNCSRSIITNQYLFGVTFMHSRKYGLILSYMIRCSRINKPLIWSRRRICNVRVTRSTKCMSMRVRFWRWIYADVVLLHCCFQGCHLLETLRFIMIIFPTKISMTLSLLSFWLGSFVIFERRSWLRGFGTLVWIIIVKILFLGRLGVGVGSHSYRRSC